MVVGRLAGWLLSVSESCGAESEAIVLPLKFLSDWANGREYYRDFRFDATVKILLLKKPEPQPSLGKRRLRLILDGYRIWMQL